MFAVDNSDPVGRRVSEVTKRHPDGLPVPPPTSYPAADGSIAASRCRLRLFVKHNQLNHELGERPALTAIRMGAAGAMSAS